MRTERTTETARGASAIPALGAVLAAGAVLVSLASYPEGSDVAGAPWATPPSAFQDTVSFAEDVLPIFRQRCAECHGAEDENGEVRTEVSLNVIDYERLMLGSEFGTVIEAGDPANSFLLDMIVDGTMPEQGDPVPEDEIAVIRAWIEAGAPNN